MKRGLVIFILICGLAYAIEPAQVNLPACENNPQAKIINSPDDFADINSASYNVFCVTPGSYNQTYHLTRGGTASSPRYLRYYYPRASSENPWHQSASEQAVLRQVYVDSPYWVIDGLTFRYNQYLRGLIYFRAGNIIVNNVLVEGSNLGIYITNGDYNYVQNSVLRETNRAPEDDSNCVNTAKAKYTRILNNELYNCNDGIQVWEREGNISYSAEGTIIENNEFYITPDMYADCLNPDPHSSLTPSGNCACAENAVDLKVGTWLEKPEIRPQDYIQVRNNIMYGYRHTHPTCGGTGSGGYAITMHHPETDYVIVENNVIFNSQNGIATLSGMDHVTIRNNLLYDINDFDGIYTSHASNDSNSVALQIGYGRNMEVYHNTVIGGSNPEYYMRDATVSYRDYDIRNNLFVNAGTYTPANDNYVAPAYIGYNGFFNTDDTSNMLSPSTNVIGTNTQFTDYCFTIKKHTNPQQYCIPAVPTVGSSFIDQGDPNVGALDNYGVDDIEGIKTDLRGNARDSQPDLGAFEYAGTQTTCLDVGVCCNACLGAGFNQYDSDCTGVCCSECANPALTLANSNTLLSHSNNCDAEHPIENLWDGCYHTTEQCSTGAGDIASFWVEFDFGQTYRLSMARLYGDTGGNWYSWNWSYFYKLTSADSWTPAFTGVDAFMNDWSEQQLNVGARYARVEVFGNPTVPATQARELEIYGTPVDCTDIADKDCDGCISIGELINAMDEWKSNRILIEVLIIVIQSWKSGC